MRGELFTAAELPEPTEAQRHGLAQELPLFGDLDAGEETEE